MNSKFASSSASLVSCLVATLLGGRGSCRAMAFSYACIFATLLGCDDGTSATSETGAVSTSSSSELVNSQQDDFKLGVDRLFRQSSSDSIAVGQLALYHLNQWLLKSSDETGWKPHPLTQRIPRNLAAIQPLQELNRNRFSVDDFKYLQGRIWQREVVAAVTERPLDEPLAGEIAQQAKSLSEDDAKQLLLANQLFDWLIRNVQLDAMATIDEAELASNKALPAERGIAGPGYTHYSWETLLFGHGDSFERARLMMELCRQAKIDSVLVSVRPKEGAAKPWAVAVLIGKDAYLFDPQLGMPLPAANHQGVATLTQLQQDPALLRQLDLDAKDSYWVKEEDLKSLEVIISASPEELSQRMARLEKQLPESRRLSTSVDISKLETRLKDFPQLGQLSLWRVPFESYLYHTGRGLRLNTDEEFRQEWERETMYLFGPVAFQISRPNQFLPTTIISQARQLELAGKFETTDAGPGAIPLLMESRPPERAIEDLPYSTQMQRQVGLEGQLAKDPVVRRKQLEYFASCIQRQRENVSYWIGLCQYEKKNFPVAIDWLQKRTLDGNAENFWTSGARFNLARCHEILGQTDAAVKLYRADSPQSYGNRLRAKWLTE